MGNRDMFEKIRIGQSAAKPRTGEGSTTIPEGSREELVIFLEVVSPVFAGEDIV